MIGIGGVPAADDLSANWRKPPQDHLLLVHQAQHRLMAAVLVMHLDVGLVVWIFRRQDPLCRPVLIFAPDMAGALALLHHLGSAVQFAWTAVELAAIEPLGAVARVGWCSGGWRRQVGGAAE